MNGSCTVLMEEIQQQNRHQPMKRKSSWHLASLLKWTVTLREGSPNKETPWCAHKQGADQ